MTSLRNHPCWCKDGQSNKCKKYKNCHEAEDNILKIVFQKENLGKVVDLNLSCWCSRGKATGILMEKCHKQTNVTDVHKKMMEIGHGTDSEELNIVMDYLCETYKGMALIDVSKTLSTKKDYEYVQTWHFYRQDICLAKRNDVNDELFKTRCPDDYDIMIMFHGAYLCVPFDKIEAYYDQIDNLIQTGIKGEKFST